MRYLTSILVTCSVVLLSASGAKAVHTFAELPDFSLLKNYAQFGNSEDESLVTINGNVGVSAGGTLHVFAPSVINGDVFVDSNATFKNDKGNNSNIHGSIHLNQNLAATQNQVSTASAQFSLMGNTPDFTFGNLNSTQNFSAAAGTVVVVDITNLNLNNNNINFSGMGYLVLNVTGQFTLGGTAGILASAGTSANHIMINYTGTGTISTHVGDEVDGYLFVAKGSANLDGTFKGGIYSGINNKVTLLSGATVSTVSP